MEKKVKWSLLTFVFLLVVIPIAIVCFTKKDFYQISDLKLVKDYSITYINGAFKNNSNQSCKSIYIDVVIQSGTLEIEDTIVLYDIEPDKVVKINDTCLDCKYLNDLNNIKIKIKNIKCYNY